MWWFKAVKEDIGGISITSGRLVVEAVSPDDANEKIRCIVGGWKSNNYYTGFSLHGPYYSEEEAYKASPLMPTPYIVYVNQLQ